MSLSLNPPKGTADRKPEEFRVRKYIFDTRRKVCESFGYQEYLGPLVEDVAIWEAKSGEDVGGTELTKITNRVGEISDLALRPEMTPTVTRMISKYQREYSKPIRRFSIANFYRNEKPQRGRNREFWQCNVDMFGSESVMGDIEILQMAVELMKSFGANKDQFQVYINDRRVVDGFLDSLSMDHNLRTEAIRTMDKRDKLSQEVFEKILKEKGCDGLQITSIVAFMKSDTLDGAFSEQINSVVTALHDLGYADFIQIKPSLMRGFDYYDGIVFEVFDLHPENNRALFGGGRYNGLAEIFGVKEPIPAVGFAPGDETMKLFLESHDLLPEDLSKDIVFLPLLEEGREIEVMKQAQELRGEGKLVVVGIKVQTEQKARDFAKKSGYVILLIQ